MPMAGTLAMSGTPTHGRSSGAPSYRSQAAACRVVCAKIPRAYTESRALNAVVTNGVSLLLVEINLQVFCSGSDAKSISSWLRQSGMQSGTAGTAQLLHHIDRLTAEIQEERCDGLLVTWPQRKYTSVSNISSACYSGTGASMAFSTMQVYA